ncbi:MAG: DUF3459 domain-containing protein [Chthoniobacterales bacterium]
MRDVIQLRRKLRISSPERGTVDGAVLGPHSFVLRYFHSLGDDRLLLLNLGPAQSVAVVPEPLLAPPAPGRGERLESSEAPE